MAGRTRTNGRYPGNWSAFSMMAGLSAQTFLFFLLLLSSRPLFSQGVSFDPQLKDFNIIHENSGMVFHEFKLLNTGNETWRVKGLINSCGCTRIEISSDSLNPGGMI